MAVYHDAPTQPQLDYVEALRKRLKLPDYMLDNWCIWTYGKRWDRMTKQDVSRLIDEMKDWTVLPARMQRAMGQQDLWPELTEDHRK